MNLEIHFGSKPEISLIDNEMNVCYDSGTGLVIWNLMIQGDLYIDIHDSY